MKKNLLYLFTVLCAMSFLTACGGDDDPVVDDSWKALSSTYQGDKLVLTLNDAAVNGTVTVNATSAEAASVTLNNAVPDDKAVAIDATLAKSGSDYSVTGETTINGATLKINGTFKSGVLTMNITRTVSSALSGTWKVKMTQAGAAVMVNIVTGDPATDAQMAAAGSMLGGMMAQKVTGVTVGIADNGTVNPITWNKTDGTTGSMPDLVSLKYIVKDNQLMLAVDKSLVTMASALLPTLGLSLDVNTLLAMFTDLGGYYGFPVNYKQDGNETTFYLNKAQLTGLVALLPALAPLLPDSPIAAMLPMLGQVIPNAQTAEIGLTFTK